MTDLNAPEPVSNRPRIPKLIPIFAAAAGGLVIGVLGTLTVQSISAGDLFASPTPTPTADSRLTSAYSACGSPTGVDVEDGGATLTIDVKGKEDRFGASYEEQACILKELKVPSRVTSHLGQTTSMDGRQTESWDGITVEWSYHPNRGSDMVITLDQSKG